MNLDEKLDKILEKYEFGNFLKTPEQNYEEAKEAIKQLIEELQTESYKKGYINKGIEEITK